ncbi:MAG: hypothetical protein ABI550_08985, partial [Ignavibacteriaceae bacterium]
MYVFAIISFFFYFSTLLLPGVSNFLTSSVAPIFNQESESSFYDYIPNVLIYSLNPGATGWFDISRNSGPFWEPGAFAGYLMIAILLNFSKDQKITNKYNVVLLIALITTFSTAGLLAFSFFLSFYFLLIRKLRIGIIFVPIILFLSFTAYNDIQIFNFKINESVDQLNSPVDVYSRRTRILSAFLDLEDVTNHPVLGRGRNNMTRY